MEWVLETRSVFGSSNYVYFVPQALNFLLTAIYRKNQWWEVKPKHTFKNLKIRASELAKLTLEILYGSNPAVQQFALETLAREIITPLEQIEYSSEKQILRSENETGQLPSTRRSRKSAVHGIHENRQRTIP